jgi:hypothetical protein
MCECLPLPTAIQCADRFRDLQMSPFSKAFFTKLFSQTRWSRPSLPTTTAKSLEDLYLDQQRRLSLINSPGLLGISLVFRRMFRFQNPRLIFSTVPLDEESSKFFPLCTARYHGSSYYARSQYLRSRYGSNDQSFAIRWSCESWRQHRSRRKLSSYLLSYYRLYTNKYAPSRALLCVQIIDGNGHGTFCASIAAGTTYGSAKKANIISIKRVLPLQIQSSFCESSTDQNGRTRTELSRILAEVPHRASSKESLSFSSSPRNRSDRQ